MRKVILILSALLFVSCADDAAFIEETVRYEYTHDDYCVMFGFIEYLHETEMFGVPEPECPTYDEMMLTAAPIVMSDLFGDTLAEGDCSEVYFLMYDYFKTVHPEAGVTPFLRNIIANELY